MNNNGPNSNNSKEEMGRYWTKKDTCTDFESGAEIFPEESQPGKYNSRCDHRWKCYKLFTITGITERN